MTQDEIIEMANKAYGINDGKPFHPSALFHLEIFAKLVAQHAKAEEREACAEIADKHIDGTPEWNSAANNIAQAIRARGQAS